MLLALMVVDEVPHGMLALPTVTGGVVVLPVTVYCAETEQPLAASSTVTLYTPAVAAFTVAVLAAPGAQV